MKKYNVLWLFCEDVSPWMSMYGDNTIKTPHLEKLCEEGINFTSCYSPCPVCSPARSGIITGCMPTTIGVHNHVSSRLEEPPIYLPDYLLTVPEIMKNNGYFTYNYGKDDYNFDYDRHKLYEGKYYTHRFYGKHGKPISWRDRQDTNQPFFGQITLWGGKNTISPQQKVDESKVKVADYYPATDVFHQHYVKHYNQILRTDEEVGYIVEALKKDGEYENTIIIFMSDHGYQLLRSKQFVYDGGIHVPLIIRLPEELREKYPASTYEDLVSSIDIAATTLQLCGIPVPTYMESKDMLASDFKRDYVISARDRCDFTIDRIRSVRTKKYKYIRNFLTDRPLMQSQYRERTQPYIQWFEMKNKGLLNEVQLFPVSDVRPAEELYDIEHDPQEIHNLAQDLAYQTVLEDMRKVLDTFISETDDKGQYPESLEEYVALIERWGEERCINPEYKEAKAYLKDFKDVKGVRIEDVL